MTGDRHSTLLVLDVFPTNGPPVLIEKVQLDLTQCGAVGQKIFLSNFNLFVHLRLTCGPHQEEGGGVGASCETSQLTPDN